MGKPELQVKRVRSDDVEFLDVIHEAFLTVARDFNLTAANAPTNPAFMSLDDFKKMDNESTEMYGAFMNGRCVGFIAIRHESASTCWLEKVSVIPDFRSRGVGKALMDFAVDSINDKQCVEIKIGIINENRQLKDWYLSYGFTVQDVMSFDHLPFEVCLMRYDMALAD